MPSTCEIATLLFILSSHCFIGVFPEDTLNDNLDRLEGIREKPSRKLAVTSKKKKIAVTSIKKKITITSKKCKKNYPE